MTVSTAGAEHDRAGSRPGNAAEGRDETTRAAAERARTDTDGDPADRTEALRNEIEQTRAELGETAAALAAKLDVPGRVKQAASDKRTELTEAVTAQGNRLAETASDLAAKAAPARLKQAATDAAGTVAAKAGAAGGKIGDLAGRVRPGSDDSGGHKAGSPSGTVRSDHAATRQETAETRTRLAESAAEVAERATTAIGTLPGRASEALGSMRNRASSTIGTFPDRIPEQRQRYALIGAALAAATIAVVMIRRLR